MSDEADKGNRDENRRLTVEEIERLTKDEFDALSKDVKEGYFDWMTRDNRPSDRECYGYTSEEGFRAELRGFVLPEEYGKSCDAPPMPSPSPSPEGRHEEVPEEPKNERAGRDLRDESPSWHELYPGLPSVEAARRDEDPIFWIRTGDYRRDTDPSLCQTWFYVAGYSADVLLGFEGPSGGFAAILSYSQFWRGCATRFYGLMVNDDDHTMEWREIDDDFLEYEGPGYLELTVDESWQPTRSSDVLKGYADYELLTRKTD